LNLTVTIAPVRKSVVVNVHPARAFDIFTSGIDRWWPKTHHIGASPLKRMVVEPVEGGRWYSLCEDGSEIGIGHVLVWEPGRRVVLTWEINAAWKNDANAVSEVEVQFLADGPHSTRVELEHRGFDRLGKERGEKMRKDVDGGWPTVLDMYVKEVERGSS
jgi:uncharacterized protein YndB with AHSA1/START domain